MAMSLFPRNDTRRLPQPASASSSRILRRRFLSCLVVIITVIFTAEALVMLLIDTLKSMEFELGEVEEAIVDAALLSVISFPLLWWLSLRKLVNEIIGEQQQVEAIGRSNAVLRDALDTHALVSIADVQGRIVHANEQFCRVSGYGQDELVGQDHRIVNSGYHDLDFFRDMWRIIGQGQVWTGVMCNRRKDGRLYWVDSTIFPLLDQKGKPQQYISIRRDITAQKESEAKLSALHRAVEASSEMLLITDAVGLIQYANPALCRFTGWKEEQLLGQSPSIFDSPNVDPDVLLAMSSKLQKGEPWSGRLLSRRRGRMPIRIQGQPPVPDSLEYWAEVNVTPIFEKGETIVGYVQIQHDVSEKVAREARLSVEREDTAARLAIAEVLQQVGPIEKRYARVLETLCGLELFRRQAKGGIFLYDEDRTKLAISVLHGAFSEAFRLGERCIERGACLCGRAAISGEVIVSDDCFCDPRHEHRYPGMSPHGHYIFPIASSGEIHGVVFIYTDPYPVRSETRVAMLRQVGEMMGLALLQDQARTSLQEARDSALQAARSKSEFLANMSHEIRTPMNGVLGMLELLQDTNMDATQWDLVKTAHSSADALLDVINDILDYSKLEAGKIELEQVEFEIAELVEEVCSLLAGRAHGKGLELNCFMPVDLPRYWRGDPTRIRQVLTNLVGNAIKFTEHGEVSVQVQCFDDPGENRALFTVKDTGIGIAPETRAKLFQPFSQADGSTARRFGGTGLGLSISRDLVAMMGGEIGVDSVLGEGACFWFRLPIEVAAQAETAMTNTDIAGRRLLVVDDNDTNRIILEHYLTHWGLEVGVAHDGPAALLELDEAIRRGKPYQLVLLDLHMPGMDGYALSKAMADSPVLAETPRLLLSSGGILSEKERKAVGIAQSLLKPVRQSQLYKSIVRLLGSQLGPELTPGQPAPMFSNYHGKRVLVAEDNRVNQKVILTMLAKFQLAPDLASNGEEVLNCLTHSTYDLILMDCQMPVMDGYETVRRIRQNEFTADAKRIPVVALTAHAADGEREKCLTAGMDDYLSKPITGAKLASILARWLDRIEVETAPMPPFDATPSVDEPCWDAQQALTRLGDDEDLLTTLIGIFLEEMPNQLVELRTARDHHDLPALAYTAHAIKGASSHFCAEAVRSRASQLELLARAEKHADFHTLTDDLIRFMEVLATTLKHSKYAQSYAE